MLLGPLKQSKRIHEMLLSKTLERILDKQTGHKTREKEIKFNKKMLNYLIKLIVP